MTNGPDCPCAGEAARFEDILYFLDDQASQGLHNWTFISCAVTVKYRNDDATENREVKG